MSQVGYTKSVDMWSLGCITAALLIGTSVFVDPQDFAYRQDSIAAITAAAARCDLTTLDTEPLWKDISSHAKDFVKQLVRLEENMRLTAEQALDHPWFTRGGRKGILQKMYEDATKSWKPHRTELDYIEDLDVLIEGRKRSEAFCARGKRRRSSPSDHEEVALRAKAGLENRGLPFRDVNYAEAGLEKKDLPFRDINHVKAWLENEDLPFLGMNT